MLESGVINIARLDKKKTILVTFQLEITANRTCIYSCLNSHFNY